MKLPRFVVRKHDGRDFYFEVPKKQRPEKWPASIRLPNDPVELVARAKELNAQVADTIVAAVNSYDESRKLLREAAEKLDALTLMLRSMKEARNGTALDMDGDELFGFVLPHESYMNAHMILNDAAWFARITAHLEAGK